MGALDDTLVLFLSDNGASAEIMVRGEGHDPTADPGSRKTFLCLGPGWSTVANAPFRRHKTWVHEGGIATPWIVHWPNGVAARGELRTQPVHVIDVVPTVLDVAGVPAEESPAASPMHGRSFAASLGAASAPPAHESLWWCHDGHRAVRVGDWKLVASRGRPWELYDLAVDRCETRDQAAGQPDRVAALEWEWRRIADECRDRAASAAAPATRPNVVIVFCDDLGYGDPSCYGGKVPTPAIDRIAREGIRFTDFHVPHPVCSASRAALLTGCYAPRVSIHGALFPTATHGISAAETTLAELLRDRGYRTAAVGKWHLGHQPEFLPTRHGFDEWLGLPYSNDMWPTGRSVHPPLPLFDGERVIDADVTAEDQATLTARYTARAVDFIERATAAGDDRPFFLYLAHTMPHTPLFVGEAFRGKSGAGVYGDVVTEIDASVGAILAALDRTGQARDTLVIFTSDNGPWLRYGDHGGSAGPLREGKGTVFEGGIREPCVARFPGVIPAGVVSDALLATIDLLPTIATLTGDPLTQDAEGHCMVAGKRIDGRDRRAAFMAAEDPAVSQAVTHWYHYRTGELQAVRRGRWKLMLPHKALVMAGQQPGSGGTSGKPASRRVGGELYDLVEDVGERHDVAAEHPDVVADLERVAEAARAELGDTLSARRGAGVRPPGGVVSRE
jgi:arylsulfatase A